MNIRTPLACTLLLCACSESAKNEFKEEFTQSFRTEFVRSATEACVEKASGKSPFDSATTEKICRCIGEKTVDQINPEEATSLLGGSDSISDELKNASKTPASPALKKF